MASQAPSGLPLFFNNLEPLSSSQHGTMKVRDIEGVPQAGRNHAIPITVDEFILCQRHYPIIFTSGDQPVPLALMGLNEGVNTFLDDMGLPIEKNLYIPAYLRRYPFMLARLREESEDLSLCFDPTANAVGEFDEGLPLFDGDQPAQATQNILAFCEQFETSGQRTAAFMADLIAAGLLMDGEVSVQPTGAPQPFVYRGFQMVDEQKLKDLRGDELRKMNQSGMLPLLFAHLFSLAQIRDLFSRQIEQGKGPEGYVVNPPEPAKA